MKKHEIRSAILRIQSEQKALYPDIPESYYSIYRQHKPREPAQTGDKKSLTKQRKHGIFYGIRRHIRRAYKAIRRKRK